MNYSEKAQRGVEEGKKRNTYVEFISLVAHRIYTQRMSASVASRVTC
jgi:hypothetical protein